MRLPGAVTFYFLQSLGITIAAYILFTLSSNNWDQNTSQRGTEYHDLAILSKPFTIVFAGGAAGALGAVGAAEAIKQHWLAALHPGDPAGLARAKAGTQHVAICDHQTSAKSPNRSCHKTQFKTDVAALSFTYAWPEAPGKAWCDGWGR